MSNITKNPTWTVEVWSGTDGYCNILEDGKLLVCGEPTLLDPEDAFKMAAAPDLLAVCEMVAAGNTELADLESAARAAITKAKGLA